MPHPITTRPQGQATRGTTNPNRLRRMDRWLVSTQGARLGLDPSPLLVDLGFGASARTAVELHERVRARFPGAHVTGIEIDPERVRTAREFARPGLDFRVGGFEIPTPRTPLVVRAFNVLRQYPEHAYREHWEQVMARLAPGGIFIDGTCDEIGRRATWLTLGNHEPLSLSISVKFGAIERPSDVAERLPKALIHRNIPGERVHELLSVLDRQFELTRPLSNFGWRAHWMGMAAGAYRELTGSAGVPDPRSVWGGPKRWRLGEFTIPWELVKPRGF